MRLDCHLKLYRTHLALCVITVEQVLAPPKSLIDSLNSSS